MKITILNDNTPGRGLLSEHGLSFYIEKDGFKILLDAGSSDVFSKNAEKLGIDIHGVDVFVLSHGHWDHGNGMKYLPRLPLIAHPAIFKQRYHSQRRDSFVGLEMSETECAAKFDMKLTNSPYKIRDGIWFLGEVPRTNGFEARSTAFYDEQGNEDFIEDDSGLAISGKNGLVVISGCAHAGIVNTIEHARQVSGQQKVQAVMGGFHLKKADALTRQTIQAIKTMNIPYVYPSHCTDLPALSLFFNTFSMNQIRTGDVLTFE